MPSALELFFFYLARSRFELAGALQINPPHDKASTTDSATNFSQRNPVLGATATVDGVKKIYPAASKKNQTPALDKSEIVATFDPMAAQWPGRGRPNDALQADSGAIELEAGLFPTSMKGMKLGVGAPALVADDGG